MKFFRKIRQDLLSGGKTRKYLKYAIGEIILVVIGILIALQINNWNETNKLNRRELTLLSELKTNLQINIVNLENDIQKQTKSIKSFNYILNLPHSNLPYRDEITDEKKEKEKATEVKKEKTEKKTKKTRGVERKKTERKRKEKEKKKEEE